MLIVCSFYFIPTATELTPEKNRISVTSKAVENLLLAPIRLQYIGEFVSRNIYNFHLPNMRNRCNFFSDTGEKPYCCEVKGCGKVFARQETAIIHKRTRKCHLSIHTIHCLFVH